VENYHLTPPATKAIPVILSIPHCGTAFPDELKEDFYPELIASPDDTDWFVDRLYNFAPSLGMTTISAVWSRWVIDLNRHPESRPLYSDGRIITDLCPVTTFLGQPLYKDRRTVVDKVEVLRRKGLYFQPYHEKLSELIADMKSQFGTVLLWDCHSIRQWVSTIRAQRFPDLILGSADENSAHPLIIQHALKNLNQGSYGVQHNDPFKGGFITRNYGKPALHQHALQLEMSKVNYMDDTETFYHPTRAKKMAELLNNTLSSIAGTLISLKD
jgi:N-formylglutamate deformylase